MKSTISWDITPLQSVESQQMFVLLTICVHAGILLGSFFDPEDGGDMFF
jgi:hypothetical protein